MPPDFIQVKEKLENLISAVRSQEGGCPWEAARSDLKGAEGDSGNGECSSSWFGYRLQGGVPHVTRHQGAHLR